MLETSLRGVAMVAPETTSFTVEKMTIDHQFELPGRLAKPQGIVVDEPWEQSLQNYTERIGHTSAYMLGK